MIHLGHNRFQERQKHDRKQRASESVLWLFVPTLLFLLGNCSSSSVASNPYFARAEENVVASNSFAGTWDISIFEYLSELRLSSQSKAYANSFGKVPQAPSHAVWSISGMSGNYQFTWDKYRSYNVLDATENLIRANLDIKRTKFEGSPYIEGITIQLMPDGTIAGHSESCKWVSPNGDATAKSAICYSSFRFVGTRRSPGK
jgi:hypothetical protein